ncbi:hypothetical protein [Bacillus inaquosorum]|uniref:hypothetical protein n=1 Tax=Bacillus inaquosorum TaxID=483913 RepID=UPI00398B61DC
MDTFIASAALRDHDFQLVAGAFDIIPVRGKEFGINLHVSPERCYSDFRNIIVENCVRSADKGAVWGIINNMLKALRKHTLSISRYWCGKGILSRLRKEH